MMSLGQIAPDLLRDIAVKNGACIRPVLSRLTDTSTGEQTVVPIPCGSTQERQCPPCADRNRRLRMQQCREGWHRTDEPLTDHDTDNETDETDDSAEEAADSNDSDTDTESESARRIRSTRRRQDVPDLPRAPMADRTIGQAFTAVNGRIYRPSMFLTLTLPSYGRVRNDGTPVDPSTYNYRRAALDALHFPKLVDRFVQNLRRCAGYKVQYFATVEAQRRLAPHLHAAVRGVIPRQIVRDVVAATYHQLWWPQCGRPVYTGTGHATFDTHQGCWLHPTTHQPMRTTDDRLPVWDHTRDQYVDPATNRPLPTWDQALDAIGADPTAEPAHVVRLGEQLDYQGIIADSEDQVNRAIGYLTKYLTKDIADTYRDPDADPGDPDGGITPTQAAHLNRLHREVRWLPCSPSCANWLRYGVQPKDAGPKMTPGHCPAKAHDRHHLGLGGRRVLVSRQWTGKTLSEHRADRAEVVRQTLAAAGIEAPDRDRCSARATDPDNPAGGPRFVWFPMNPNDADAPTYRRVMADTITERARWRIEYEHAKQALQRAGPAPPGDGPGSNSAIDNEDSDAAHKAA